MPEMRSGLSGLTVAATMAAILLAACEPRQAAQKPDRSPRQFGVVEATIGDIQDAITAGKITCRAIVEKYLHRIETYDASLGINAITVINPDALRVADRIDTAIAAGEPLGPLFCAPMLIKDNFNTIGLPTTGGSAAMADNIPTENAFMVARLIDADAIVLAKTNMAEWAFSPRQTISSSYGRTTNVYAPGRTPAGSSGGTASGVAASFAVAGLGSDTGNSIRGPASHLALFGIRSTIGLTSRAGVVPLAFDRDIAGPMTRTVEDGARIFNIVAGYDPDDPYTELGKDRRESDYTVFLDAAALAGKRIGIVRALAEPEESDPEIMRLFENAVADLTSAGAEMVDPFIIPNLTAHLDGDYFCARFRYDMAQYLSDPAVTTALEDVTSVLDTGQYDPHAKSGLEFFRDFPAAVHPADWSEPCPDYAEHSGRLAYRDDVIAAMDDANVDAVIYPSWTWPPADIDRAFEDYRGDNSQLIAPATGLPAVNVPMGYSYGGLPAGLQILGRPYDEGLLIALAYSYEQATGHRRPPPLTPELKEPRDNRNRP